MKGIGRYARECDHEGVEHVVAGDVCLIPHPRANIEVGYDLHYPRARRYAEALAAAAAADKRIELLIEQVAEHEWYRSQAEQQVDSIQTLFNLVDIQMYTATGIEPNVECLLDLYSGKVWERKTTYRGESVWISAAADPHGQLEHAWPIQDAGPFFPIADAWEVGKISADARSRDVTENTIRNKITQRPGYAEDGQSRYSRPALGPAVCRVVDELDRKAAGHLHEKNLADLEIANLKRQLAAAEAKVAELTIDEEADA